MCTCLVHMGLSFWLPVSHFPLVSLKKIIVAKTEVVCTIQKHYIHHKLASRAHSNPRVHSYLSETDFSFCWSGFPPLGRTRLPHSAPPPVRQPGGWWGGYWGSSRRSLRLRSRAPWRGSCRPAAWPADADRHLSTSRSRLQWERHFIPRCWHQNEVNEELRLPTRWLWSTSSHHRWVQLHW